MRETCTAFTAATRSLASHLPVPSNVRSMRTPTLITCLAVAVALGACGSDDEPDRPPAPAKAAAVKPLPTAPDVELGAGRYEAKAFRPGLTMQLPKDVTWRLLGPTGQTERHFGLEAIGQDYVKLNALAFHRFDVVADPKRGTRTRADAVKAPADFIDWLAHHPHLEASKPKDVEIAGVTGRSIDVEAVSTPKRMPDECRESGIDCLPLFYDGDEPIIYNVGAKMRFISLDVGDEPVVVEMFAAPGDGFAQSVALMQPVLDSVRFTSEH